MLDEDPELDSSVLGRTTGSDEPATEDGVDLSGGDDADAATDGGPDLPEDAEPDLKDIGAASPEATPRTTAGACTGPRAWTRHASETRRAKAGRRS